MSGWLADLIQIPDPHASHHARVISVPLSPFCAYVLGAGLDVWMSAVRTKRCAECLEMKGSTHTNIYKQKKKKRSKVPKDQ